MCNVLAEQVLLDHGLEATIGAYVFREGFSLFMQSALIDRCFSKPRGYACDYFAIEMMYRDQAAGAGTLGPYIDQWMLHAPVARAVRNRRNALAAIVGERAARSRRHDLFSVTSLGSGPARELFDVLARPASREMQVTCVDSDVEALAYVMRVAQDLGVATRMTFAQGNAVQMAQGRGSINIPAQDIIYSAGLSDYMADQHVVQLIDWIHDHLSPGGLVVIGCVDSSNPHKAYMDHVLEWELMYRGADDIRDLFANSKFGDVPVDVQHDATGVQLLASCTKQ
jgi:SAM-dependent methyltransferase